MSEPESAAGGSVTLTDAQLSFLASMMRNSKSKPDIDWDGVATECGGLTAKSAKERYRVMSLKFGWNAKSGGDGESSGPKTPKTPKKPAGVSKRTGRIGNSAIRGKGKKVLPVQDEDENGGGEVVKSEHEEDNAGEA